MGLAWAVFLVVLLLVGQCVGQSCAVLDTSIAAAHSEPWPHPADTAGTVERHADDDGLQITPADAAEADVEAGD